jgi:hypothetical protein
VESPHPEALQKMLKDPVIQQCRLRRNVDAAEGSEENPDGFITQVHDEKDVPQVRKKYDRILCDLKKLVLGEFRKLELLGHINGMYQTRLFKKIFKMP